MRHEVGNEDENLGVQVVHPVHVTRSAALVDPAIDMACDERCGRYLHKWICLGYWYTLFPQDIYTVQLRKCPLNNSRR